MQLDKKLTHWGEAAFYFSMDLSSEFYALIFGDLIDGAEARDLCRKAILQNRNHQARTGMVLYLHDLFLEGARDRTALSPFADFVERELVTASRPQNRDAPLLKVLCHDDLNAAVSLKIQHHLKGVTFRERLYQAMDAKFCNALFEAAISVDSAIQTKNLSEWDDEIIERNKAMYGVSNPLEGLIFSADLKGRNSALRSVVSGLSEAQILEIKKMCEHHAED
jgi:hypothetical protein